MYTSDFFTFNLSTLASKVQPHVFDLRYFYFQLSEHFYGDVYLLFYLNRDSRDFFFVFTQSPELYEKDNILILARLQLPFSQRSLEQTHRQEMADEDESYSIVEPQDSKAKAAFAASKAEAATEVETLASDDQSLEASKLWHFISLKVNSFFRTPQYWKSRCCCLS